MALVISSVMLTGTAFAHKTPKKEKTEKLTDPSTCIVRSLPLFVAQGEFASASSVADIIEIECEPIYAEHFVKVSSMELYNSCDDSLSWSAIGNQEDPYAPVTGSSISKVRLDDDGNATIAVWGGPSCASTTESLISAHLEEAPYETFTATFSVGAPHTTTPGVWVLPESQVEDDTFSNAATIVQVEFPPVDAGGNVVINAEQLHARCGHVEWVGPDENVLGSGETVTVKLDNDGNAFVVVLGGPSCASGMSEIEASLEAAPYTTYRVCFYIYPPEPTI
jgi:hypothetical protein